MKNFKVYQASTDIPYVFFDFDVAYKRFDFEKDYMLVCEETTELDDIDQILNEVFEKGNTGELTSKNGASKMRSVSVSDIIEVDGMYFYVEGFGFRDITSYINK